MNQKQPPVVIIDASVGVKWLFREELCEEARALLKNFREEQSRFIVPEFFFLEIASVCKRRVQQKIISWDIAAVHLDSILSLGIEKYSVNDLSDVAFENSCQYGISVYDGIYLALAEVYLAPLITADNAFYSACKGKFDFIEHLSQIDL